ncbi:hypothetical protein Ssi03_12700 [Sphaerisporangium siamense]|uniref:Uncharacterized protein n=1 Tax=Sphaerisporangium siamense TaxID=795645 RepID=A0A7W7DAE6_9ACTN|nr:hypothetical protein [Sphaerisporangium siamense]MBB4702961.1 hypothetical protein [Sphaerisporangium siamense]GII83280.1 hypothetical protein Ssi03_12700 [Sphaerisporangium siamense]
MSDEDHIQGCGPGGFCGTCPTPCFLRDQESFDSLVEQEPDDDYDTGYGPEFDGLAEALDATDTDTLGCARWDDPEAHCPTDTCAGNFFCWTDYSLRES